MAVAVKNFDEARQERQIRTRPQFQIGGQVFTISAGVHPDDLAEFDRIGDGTGIGETLGIVDRVLLSMILDEDGSEGGGHLRYRQVRENRADPVTISDLVELAEWLISAQADRPTDPSPPSSSGRDGTGTTSTAGSSSPDSPGA